MRVHLPPHEHQRLLTVREVAEILRVSERTVRRLIAERKLRVARIGRSVRVTPKTVAALTGDDT